ncbi:unnamed protein product [Menidia menidia]|uniref:(Atlantic silverside) hypothetical protein n=1 Tax=Menidia menidia TaxID=238744 RepID=A0A8S4BLP3_9TELE|nr:unnamed protein product [Menidia menidia]
MERGCTQVTPNALLEADGQGQSAVRRKEKPEDRNTEPAQSSENLHQQIFKHRESQYDILGVKKNWSGLIPNIVNYSNNSGAPRSSAHTIRVLPCFLDPPLDVSGLTVEWKFSGTQLVHFYRSKSDSDRQRQNISKPL